MESGVCASDGRGAVSSDHTSSAQAISCSRLSHPGFSRGSRTRKMILERGALKPMARPRKYPPELLDRGARLVFESGRPIARVARQERRRATRGVGPGTDRRWRAARRPPRPRCGGAHLRGADLRARRVLTGVAVETPGEGRPLTRINWMVRQLRDAPDDLRIDVQFARTSETTSLLLAEARDEPKRLLSPTEPKRQPRSFELARLAQRRAVLARQLGFVLLQLADPRPFALPALAFLAPAPGGLNAARALEVPQPPTCQPLLADRLVVGVQLRDVALGAMSSIRRRTALGTEGSRPETRFP